MPRDSGANDQITLRFQVDGPSCVGGVGRSEQARSGVDGVETTDIAIEAAGAMVLSSVYVVSNALRLRFIKPGIEVQK